EAAAFDKACGGGLTVGHDGQSGDDRGDGHCDKTEFAHVHVYSSLLSGKCCSKGCNWGVRAASALLTPQNGAAISYRIDRSAGARADRPQPDIAATGLGNPQPALQPQYATTGAHRVSVVGPGAGNGQQVITQAGGLQLPALAIEMGQAAGETDGVDVLQARAPDAVEEVLGADIEFSPVLAVVAQHQAEVADREHAVLAPAPQAVQCRLG